LRDGHGRRKRDKQVQVVWLHINSKYFHTMLVCNRTQKVL
jgi:hypothetical protein